MLGGSLQGSGDAGGPVPGAMREHRAQEGMTRPVWLHEKVAFKVGFEGSVGVVQEKEWGMKEKHSSRS